MGNEWRPIQMEQPDLKRSGCSQRFEFADQIVFAEVLGQVVPEWMKDEEAGSGFFRRWPIITFVLIAATAGIDKVWQIISSACGAGLIVINREFSTSGSFLDAAIGTAK